MTTPEIIQDYKEQDCKTGINTRISDTMRISSIWRSYSNEYFSTRAWETFLWDGDRIACEYNTLRDADAVVNLHLSIVNDIKNGGDGNVERDTDD